VARIAITGGTGFVGIHTSKALSRAGHQLRLIARGTRRIPRSPGVEMVRGDVVSDNGNLVDALRGCDVVVHLVAIIRERGRQTLERVNRQGAENVASAARQAGVGHIVHLSANGADPDPYFAYLASKWNGEQAVIASGVPYTVLRPSIIFGPGDGFFTVLTKLIRLNPVIPVVGDGRAMFQPIAASDVARIISDCIERGPDHLSYEQILDVIKAELGVHRFKVHVPVMAMLPLAVVMDKVLPKPPVTPGQLRLLKKNNITRLDAVPTQFGFQPLAFPENCGYLHDY
jgi:NADH dehydrogenase